MGKTVIVILIVFVLAGTAFMFWSEIKSSPENNEVSQVDQVVQESNSTIEEEKPEWDLEEEVIYEIPSDHELSRTGTKGYYNEPNVYFSKDGQGFAYQFYSKEKKGWTSIRNGIEGGWNQSIESVFSRESDQGNFIKIKPVKKGSTYYVVYKGKTIGEMEKTPSSAAASTDEEQYVFVVISDKNSKRKVHMNGEVGSEYRIIGMQTCSPTSHAESCYDFSFGYDGVQNSYIAQKSQMSNVIVLNGEEGKVHREIHFPIFSFNSKHFAYKALDKQAYMVINGKKQKKYEGIYNVRFREGGSIVYNAISDNKILYVTQNYIDED